MSCVCTGIRGAENHFVAPVLAFTGMWALGITLRLSGLHSKRSCLLNHLVSPRGGFVLSLWCWGMLGKHTCRNYTASLSYQFWWICSFMFCILLFSFWTNLPSTGWGNDSGWSACYRSVRALVWIPAPVRKALWSTVHLKPQPRG